MPLLEAELAHEHVAAARDLLDQIDRLSARVASLFPVHVETFPTLPEDDGYRLLAFLKRFEELQDLTQRKLFRLVLITEDEDPRDYTTAELVGWIEKLGLVETRTWRAASSVRNVLVHDYPLNAAQEVDRANSAWTNLPTLRAGADAAIKHLMSRGIAND